jgi:hypothetical protein
MENSFENPISDVFGDLITNQKMSVINLLSLIASWRIKKESEF